MFSYFSMAQWCSELDTRLHLRTRGRGFDSWLIVAAYRFWAIYFYAVVSLSLSSLNLVPVNRQCDYGNHRSGRLALHWPFVKDFNSSTIYEFKVYEMESSNANMPVQHRTLYTAPLQLLSELESHESITIRLVRKQCQHKRKTKKN